MTRIGRIYADLTLYDPIRENPPDPRHPRPIPICLSFKLICTNLLRSDLDSIGSDKILFKSCLIHPNPVNPVYSYRSAVIGSTFAARRAGMSVAMKATSESRRGVARKVIKSVALTP